MGRTTRETWARRVEQWKASGLTATEFAPRLGIKPSALSWWKWRLGSSRPKGNGARRVGRKTPPAVVTPLTFVEMTAARVEPLEVVLTSGVRVIVRDDFDSATLSRLVAVLERRG